MKAKVDRVTFEKSINLNVSHFSSIPPPPSYLTKICMYKTTTARPRIAPLAYQVVTKKIQCKIVCVFLYNKVDVQKELLFMLYGGTI